MEYILIPSKSKSETTFLLNLLKKVQKEVSTFSKAEMEDFLFTSLLKDAEKSTKGSLINVKSHLSKIINDK
ncbi:MAG: hypothetical protein ACKVQB_03275 [Bacteroidia bacterium]